MKTQIRVLHLEDNELDAELVRSAMKAQGWDCRFTCVSNRQQFEHAVVNGTFDLILSDYRLSGYDGSLALRFVRANNPAVPFIVVSGAIGETRAVGLLKNGATNYLPKSQIARLGAAVQHALEEADNHTKRRDAEKALRQLSARLMRVQDEERRQLGRDLHDTVAQNLALQRMTLSTSLKLAPSSETKLRELLTECLDLADRTAQQVRTLSYILHPPTLDILGLPRALREFVSGFSARSGIKIDLVVADDFGRVSWEIETTLFNVARECFTNIHRHASSSTASVQLRQEMTGILLEVKDDGAGIPPEKLSSLQSGTAAGVGIAGMRERLRYLGGRLEIESGTNGTQGTLVRAVIPHSPAP